jgi:two-component system sensor histidine kinase RpfC
LSHNARNKVSTIDASAHLLLGLLQDILDISKIEAGKLDVNYEALDLHALVNGVVSSMLLQASDKGLRLSSYIHADVPFKLYGDPLRIRQVLLNLIGNAVKFTPQGYVEIRVILVEQKQDTVFLRFEVADSGIGMKPEVAQSIFKEFAQADASITRKFGGTGLGTTISKQLVELMGGKIGVESKLNVGSHFWFELPLSMGMVSSSGHNVIEDVSVDWLVGKHCLLLSNDQRLGAKWQAWVSNWGGMADVQYISTGIEGIVTMLKNRMQVPDLLIFDGRDIAEPDKVLRRIQKSPQYTFCKSVLLQAEPNQLIATEFDSAIVSSAPKKQWRNSMHAALSGQIQKGQQVVDISQLLEARKSSRQLRVLVAEDNATNQMVIREILERAHYQPVFYDDGEQALDALLEEPEAYDIAIVDLHMPGLGGLELIKQYRYGLMYQDTMPFIVLSANTATQMEKECIGSGAKAYLTKPIDMQKLLQAMDQVIQGASKGEEEPVMPPATPVKSNNVITPARFNPPPPEVFDLGIPTETLDQQELVKLRMLNSDVGFIQRLARTFEDNMATLCEQIDTAVAQEKWTEVSELGHAMKGTAGSIGGVELSDLGHRIEFAQDRTSLLTMLKDIRPLADRTIKALAIYNEHLQARAKEMQ